MVEVPELQQPVLVRNLCSSLLIAAADVCYAAGHYFRMPQSPTDVFLPAIDSDKSLVAVLQHTEKLQPGSECYVQVSQAGW
jgi:hypothetical protein